MYLSIKLQKKAREGRGLIRDLDRSADVLAVRPIKSWKSPHKRPFSIIRRYHSVNACHDEPAGSAAEDIAASEAEPARE